MHYFNKIHLCSMAKQIQSKLMLSSQGKILYKSKNGFKIEFYIILKLFRTFIWKFKWRCIFWEI